MPSFIKKHREVAIWLLPISIFLLITTYLSEGTSGGADSYVHYRIARWSFAHPQLLFDHWGKPLYTILMAPIAQLGFVAVKVANMLLAILAAFIAYDTAKRLKIKAHVLVIPIVLLSSLYPHIANSSLTEILFSLLAVLGVNRLAAKQPIAAAIVISFIPFARTEGFIFIILFAAFFVVRKEWRFLPFLLTGALVLSLAGWGIHEDLFWVWNKNPYTGAKDIYGTGELLHFFNAGHRIFGNLGQVIIYAGSIVALGISLVNIKKNQITLLIIAMAWGYFAAHSFVWWKGMGGSLGLIRVICGITPLMAILAAYAFEWIPIRFYNIAKWGLAPTLIVVMALQTSAKYPFILPIDEETALVKKSAEWIDEEFEELPFIAYYNPLFTHFLELDFMDGSKSRERISHYEDPGVDMPAGALILWDSHFGPSEGRLPQETLDNAPRIELIKVFYPAENSYLKNHEIRAYQVK